MLRVFVVGTFIIGILLLGARATTKSVSEADLAEVKAVAQRFCDAFAQKDLDGVMDCFRDSPDLIAVPMGNATRGA